MARRISQPGQIHLRIIEVMKRFPEGISAGQIRHQLEREGISSQDLRNLDSLIRELYEWFIIEKSVIAQNALRKTLRARKQGLMSQILRARVLYTARGRCQRCGKTFKTHGINLAVERKRKRDPVGIDDGEDYWAICEECRAGRKSSPPHPSSIGVRPRFERCQTLTSR